MTHDFTYLNQLPARELLDRARRGHWTGPEMHMIRALAERLDEFIDKCLGHDVLHAALMDANQRAEQWREEAQALQRQLDQVRT